MINRFTKKAELVIQASKKCAERLGHSYIGSEHLLLGLLDIDCVAKKLLEDKDISYKSAYSKVYEISSKDSDELEGELTPKFKRIIEKSSAVSKKFNNKVIGSEHILYALCEEFDSVGARVLISLGISLQLIRSEISSYLDAYSQVSQAQKEKSPSSVLYTYGKNLNEQARDGVFDPLIGRASELDRLIQILSRRTKNNPCLIGEPGVGKTAIVEGLARKIVEGDIPEGLSDKVIISLDLSSMIAGAKYRGEFEERMKNVLNEVRNDPSIILFIDELHTIIGAGSAEGAVDAANIIKPALSRGQIQLIGATTTKEYRRHIEKDSALERRFQPIMIEEPSKDGALDILFGLKERYESFHNVKITDDAIYSAVNLSKRYLNDRFLPDKAIDLLDEGCSLVKMRHFARTPKIKELEEKIKCLSKRKENAILSEDFLLASSIRDEELSERIELKRLLKSDERSRQGITPVLTSEEIKEVLSLATHIPVSRLDKTESEILSSLEEIIKREIIGQDEAVKLVASSIKRSRMGLKNPNKPIGTFLFLGPSGVGKTELARVISKTVFNSSDALIRLDMSEYMEKHSVSKLIGSPPGYIGYDEGGLLCDMVRKKPYSLILFDEIEKAHSEIYNILLQILDSGSLTDSQGRRVDFKNTIIILTSNIGAKNITEPKRLGFSGNISENEERLQMKAKINDALKHEFNPEFLNRLDEIVIFNKLSLDDTRKITEIMLSELVSLGNEISISLSFDDSVTEYLAKKSYDSLYGARPIERAITSLIENPLSDEILHGKINEGDSVEAFLENDEVKFKVIANKK